MDSHKWQIVLLFFIQYKLDLRKYKGNHYIIHNNNKKQHQNLKNSIKNKNTLITYLSKIMYY